MSINLCLNKNIIEGFFVAVFKHTLKIFAVVVGAGHGAVDVSADDDQIVAFCVIAADVELTFNGLFGLPFGTIPRIDHSSLHFLVRQKPLPPCKHSSFDGDKRNGNGKVRKIDVKFSLSVKGCRRQCIHP